VGDLRIELQDVLLAGPPRERPRRGPLLAGAAALLAALALAWLLRPRAGEGAPTSPGVVRAVLGVGSEVRLWLGASRSLAISRDGSRVAFVGEQSGRTQLYLRELDAFEAHALADSEDARNPFFSPDGAWIGYFARGELRKVSVAGRAAERLAAAGNESRGAAWGDDGRIVFAQAHAEGLFLLEPGSGAARLITSVDRPAGEQEHLWPEWLPAGRGLVFTVRRRGPAGSVDELFVLGPDEKAGRRLRPGSQPVFAGTGHLLFLSAGGVEAAPFDLSSRELRGAAASVLDAVHTYPQGAAAYALARAGTFVYLPPVEANVLDWVGPAGDVMALPTPPGTPGWPRIAPDGRRVAIHVGRPGSREVWLLDAARAGAFRQLTFAGGGFPVWSADGRWIAFASRSDDAPSLYVVPADGDAPPRRVYAGRGTVVPTAWSRQGMLAFYEVTEARQRDVLVLDVESGGPAAPVVAGPANELAPSFSPDGRLLAYVSNETGRNEVWVRPFPPRGPATAVTVDGGIEPVWSRDGSRLLYRAGDSLWAVEVQGPGPVRLGAPRKLLDTAMVPNAAGNPGYDLAPDGRFLILRGASGVAADTLHVVLGFERELARPTAGRPR
jgi:serine/threonine-protein kinase